MWQSSASRLWLCWAAADRPAAAGRRDRQRQGGAAAEHVLHLRRLVDDLVQRHADEVHEHEVDDRPQAGDGGADAEADDRLLADRRVDDALARRTPSAARRTCRTRRRTRRRPRRRTNTSASSSIAWRDGLVERLAVGQLAAHAVHCRSSVVAHDGVHVGEQLVGVGTGLSSANSIAVVDVGAQLGPDRLDVVGGRRCRRRSAAASNEKIGSRSLPLGDLVVGAVLEPEVLHAVVVVEAVRLGLDQRRAARRGGPARPPRPPPRRRRRRPCRRR